VNSGNSFSIRGWRRRHMGWPITTSPTHSGHSA